MTSVTDKRGIPLHKLMPKLRVAEAAELPPGVLCHHVAPILSLRLVAKERFSKPLRRFLQTSLVKGSDHKRAVKVYISMLFSMRFNRRLLHVPFGSILTHSRIMSALGHRTRHII